MSAFSPLSLGFPIVDDPLYNSYDWGESKGAFAKYREPRSELIAALAASRNRSTYLKTAVSSHSVTSVTFLMSFNHLPCHLKSS